MKSIHTACGSFVTGTKIADAVSAYGLVLARARLLDVVDIPFISADGAVNRAQIRIGWLVDTVVTSGVLAADELVEVDTTATILDRTQTLTTHGSGAPARWKSDQHTWRDFNWDEVI